MFFLRKAKPLFRLSFALLLIVQASEGIGQQRTFVLASNVPSEPLEVSISPEFLEISSSDFTEIQLKANASGGSTPYVYSWSPDVGLDSAGSSTPFLDPEVASSNAIENYEVTVIDHLGCEAVAQILLTFDDPLVITPDDLELFPVFPNPSTGVFSTRITSPETITVTIHDLKGKQLHLQTLDLANQTIDLSHLGTGSYLLRASRGNELTTRKIVIR